MKAIPQNRQNNYRSNRPFHVAEPCRRSLWAGTQTCCGFYLPWLPSLAPLPARRLPQPFHIGEQVLPLHAALLHPSATRPQWKAMNPCALLIAPPSPVRLLIRNARPPPESPCSVSTAPVAWIVCAQASRGMVLPLRSRPAVSSCPPRLPRHSTEWTATLAGCRRHR